MDDLLQQILESNDPCELMEEAVWQAPTLRRLSSNIFSSLFSTHVDERPASWTARVAETALELSVDEKASRYSRDWLLEIAFHGNLALSGTDTFDFNINRIDEALQRLEPQGVTRSSQYVKGLIAYARDDLTTAERAFSTLPNLIDTQLLAHQSGYAAFRSPDFYRTLINYHPPLRLDFVQDLKPTNDTSVLLLCSVDQLYFTAFADEFVAQVFAVSPTAHIHFHLINPAQRSRLHEDELLANDRVSATVEQTDLPRPGIYAIMARFIILPLLMKEWQKPILITDVDLVVRNDPVELNARNPVTLGFSRVPAATHIPSTTILGGHSLFQPNKAGLEFARILSRYLHYMCVNQKGLWSADQVALLMVRRMLKDVVEVGDFGDHRSYKYGPSPERPLRKKAAEEKLRALAL